VYNTLIAHAGAFGLGCDVQPHTHKDFISMTMHRQHTPCVCVRVRVCERKFACIHVCVRVACRSQCESTGAVCACTPPPICSVVTTHIHMMHLNVHKVKTHTH
jgi:hypothetical protein